MKKMESTLGSRLSLSRESIRVLVDGRLAIANGGAPVVTTTATCQEKTGNPDDTKRIAGTCG